MTDPTPAQLRAEADALDKLLEGTTEGKWFCYGDEDEMRVGMEADELTYIIADNICNPQDAELTAQSKRLARAHANLLRRHAEVLAIAEAARKLYANRLGWSKERNPYAPRELWDELGRALGADPAGFCDPPDVCRSCHTPVARRSEMYTTEDGDLVCADCAEFCGEDEDDAQAPTSAEGGEG